MTARSLIITLLILIICSTGFALEPDEILLIVNRQISDSKRIAEYYSEKRNIPDKNIIYLALGLKPTQTISRDMYERSLALPIKKRLQRRAPGEIRCLVTTYGIPIKVGSQGPKPGMGRKINELKERQSKEKQKLEQLKQNSQPSSYLILDRLLRTAGRNFSHVSILYPS